MVFYLGVPETVSNKGFFAFGLTGAYDDAAQLAVLCVVSHPIHHILVNDTNKIILAQVIGKCLTCAILVFRRTNSKNVSRDESPTCSLLGRNSESCVGDMGIRKFAEERSIRITRFPRFQFYRIPALICIFTQINKEKT